MVLCSVKDLAKMNLDITTLTLPQNAFSVTEPSTALATEYVVQTANAFATKATQARHI